MAINKQILDTITRESFSYVAAVPNVKIDLYDINNNNAIVKVYLKSVAKLVNEFGSDYPSFVKWVVTNEPLINVLYGIKRNPENDLYAFAIYVLIYIGLYYACVQMTDSDSFTDIYVNVWFNAKAHMFDQPKLYDKLRLISDVILVNGEMLCYLFNESLSPPHRAPTDNRSQRAAKGRISGFKKPKVRLIK